MIRMECTTGGHNKFYEFHTTNSNGRITVKGIYGAIGQAGVSVVIYDGVSQGEADKEFQKKQNEKLKKGYVVVSNNGQSVQQPVQKKTVIHAR